MTLQAMNGRGGFDIGKLASGIWETASRETGKALAGAEDAACDVWQAVLPPQLQDALKFSQRQPWRDIWRGFNLTAPSLLPLAVMPFTFPLVFVFYPMMIWLETSRIAFAVFANCGRVSQTLRMEAADLIRLLEALSPNTVEGRMARDVLVMVGASDIVAAYDKLYPKVKAVLGPISMNQTVPLGAVVGFAEVSVEMGGNADLKRTFEQTEQKWDLLEGELADALVEKGALSPAAAIKARPEYSTAAGRSNALLNQRRRDPATKAKAKAKAAAAKAAKDKQLRDETKRAGATAGPDAVAILGTAAAIAGVLVAIAKARK